MANTTGKKFGGRRKGTPNKVTKELRSILKDFLFYELESLDERMEQLTTKERIDVMVKLMPYIFPKLEKIHPNSNEPMDWEL